MAESGGEKLTGASAEKAESKLSLEKKKAPEVNKEKIEKDVERLAEKGKEAKSEIAKAEKAAEKEKTEARLAKKVEKPKEVAEKGIEKTADASTKAGRKRIYKKELKQVQEQLSPASRTFSKVIHNTTVETVSNAADVTVLRPSALIGGALVGIILGGLLYFSARYYGYVIPNWSLLILLLAGGIIGIIIELLLKATNPKTR